MGNCPIANRIKSESEIRVIKKIKNMVEYGVKVFSVEWKSISWVLIGVHVFILSPKYILLVHE